LKIELDTDLVAQLAAERERADKLESDLTLTRKALEGYALSDSGKIIETINFCGIPLKELKDLYPIVEFYRIHGCSPYLIEREHMLIAADEMRREIMALYATYGWHVPSSLIESAVKYGKLRLPE
jgi:hypothetical protein